MGLFYGIFNKFLNVVVVVGSSIEFYRRVLRIF